MPTPKVTDDREGIQLLDTGTIHVFIDGVDFRIARPRVRTFRQLREMAEEIVDELDDLAAEVTEWQRDLTNRARSRDDAMQSGGDSEPLVNAEERAERRKRNRELSDRREERWLEWWITVGEKCVERSGWPSEVDEMPAWMGTTDAALALVKHWRTAPSLSGVR